MKTKHSTVGIDIKENGQIVLKTDAEEIPTAVVQEILDNVIGTVVNVAREKYKHEEKDRSKYERMYKYIAIFELIIIILIAIKLS